MKAFLTRYRFFLSFILLDIVLCLAMPEKGSLAVSSSFDSLIEMLSIIPPVFILMGLMDVWISKGTMMKYLGKGSGFLGACFSFLLGAFSAGPLYAAFPLAALFLRKGASLFNVFLFLGTWSVAKIPMMLFEITQLGARFTLLRFTLNLVGIILIAFAMARTSDEEREKEIRDRAEEAETQGQSQKQGSRP